MIRVPSRADAPLMECVVSDEEVLVTAAQLAMAEVRSRLRSGSWRDSLEADRRHVVTQWITLILPGVEHTGLGRQLATSTSSEDRAAEIERSVLASLAPKATATVKKQVGRAQRFPIVYACGHLWF
eukprot:2532028-Amphidinium_carterae.1